MSYPINKTDGSTLVTLLDGTTNSQFGVTLIGKNYTSYGEIQNENFLHLLESFASDLPPGVSANSGFMPIAGQVWWDTANKVLKVYDGLEFIPANAQTPSATAPAIKQTGDQWFDTVNQQLFVWTSTEWKLIGPSFTAGQTKSGAFVEAVTDNASNTHLVIAFYINGSVVAVQSNSATFTPVTTGYTVFPTIQSGLNLLPTATLNSTANNSVRLNGFYANAFARVDINSTFSQDVAITGNVVLTGANVYYKNNSLTLENTTYTGNVDLYQNTSASGRIKTISFDGATGLGYVSGDPVVPLGIASKRYVDTFQSVVNGNVIATKSALSGSITQLRSDTDGNLAAVVASTNANLISVQSSINSNVSVLSTIVTSNIASFTANALSQENEIAAINARLPLLATFNSPALTGKPTAPAAPALVNYLNTLGSLQYYYVLTSPITVATGDYIVQKDPATFAVLSNVKAVNSGTISNITVQLISGTVTVTGTDQVYQNGSQVLVHVNGFTSTGTQPAFLGLGDTSSSIATTAYVDVTANVLYGDYNSKINTEIAARQAAIANAINPLANIASPGFTGNPTAPTPLSGDSSTNIATTAFVTQAITAQKFNYTVSTSGPSGGNDGDFWFQIG
jgi:hypothetical protein